MTQRVRTQGLSNFFILLFVLIQFLILFFAFDYYVDGSEIKVSNIESNIGYNEPVIFWASFYTIVNCFLLLFVLKQQNNKFFAIRVFCLALASVFGTASIFKAAFGYSGWVGIIFLIFGLLSYFFDARKTL